MNIENLLLNQRKNFEEFVNQLNQTNLIELSYIISSNKNKTFYFIGVGKSGNVAKHISDLFKCISIKSIYLNILNLTHGDLGCIDEDDFVFIFSRSGNTQELLNCVEYLKGTLFLFCSNNKSKLKKYVNKVYQISCQNELDMKFNLIPTNSIINTITYFNILINLVIDKIEFSLEQYNQNHPKGNIGFLTKPLIYFVDKNVKTYPINLTIRECISSLNYDRKGILIFVEDNKFYGVITNKDIINLYDKDININDNVLEHINKNPIKFDKPLNIVGNYINKIKNYKFFKYIPVVRNNKFIGLIDNSKIIDKIN